ncbi:TIGR01777 family oxidoreductase [Pseudomonas sp. RL_15y_Pfl2_60]|uniref:TIGR01777 family oxidoreductase n=1 Tax=Pseudomonas sp. RL_15y_Pfl2_60 TaxID=3088709 RepID=UPI0030DC915B
MHILLTGGTGLIGQGLCHFWAAQGHQLSVWSRRPEQVKALCGDSVRGVANLDELKDQTIDAVINLAGAPIADKPWSAARKALLRESRIALTEQLIAWLTQREQKPDVLISGSAVGWYGDGGDQALTEESPQMSDDFASRLCADWESAALQAQALGIRVVLVRTGLVLAADGGMLKRLLLPFRLGLGGRIGSGQQWMPWVHLSDQIALIDFLLQHQQASGPYNACSPHPVRNREFTNELGHALNRFTVLPVPGFLLRAGLGEMSILLLGGQRAQPKRLTDLGFEFRFTHLDVALTDLLSPTD